MKEQLARRQVVAAAGLALHEARLVWDLRVGGSLPMRANRFLIANSNKLHSTHRSDEKRGPDKTVPGLTSH